MTINDTSDAQPDFDPDENPEVTKLVMSLAKYVRPSDVQLNRINFIRTVCARLLEELGA
jgi:hypothetical protein